MKKQGHQLLLVNTLLVEPGSEHNFWITVVLMGFSDSQTALGHCIFCGQNCTFFLAYLDFRC